MRREKFSEQEMLGALETFGCTAPLKTKVKMLSALDKQRVALARSLLKRPSAIFVDDIFEIATTEGEAGSVCALYSKIFEVFNFCTTVFALDDKHFKTMQNELKKTQIDKVLYLNLAHLFEFGSINQFCDSCTDLDFFDFVSGYSCLKAQIVRLEKKFFLEIEQKREVELDAGFADALAALKLDSGGFEECSVIFEGEFDYVNLTDGQINSALKAGKIKIYSNLDRKRVI